LTKRPLKNIAASVRQRLLNKSRSDVRPFQELVQYYAMERFLYRLSQSQHANRFIEPAHKLKIDQNKLQNCRSNILNLVNVL